LRKDRRRILRPLADSHTHV